MSALLTVRNLSVRFRTDEGLVTAVEDVSFSLDAGQVIGLVGESGSGKSVTAKSLMCLNPGNAIFDKNRYGESSRILLELDGQQVDVMALRGSRQLRLVRGGAISMIFQEPMASFAPAITIGDQMVEQLRIHRALDRREATAVSIEMLERVGVSEAPRRFRQYAFELSGGMRQRAMIAMALSTRPKVLIADEPTTALDVTIQAQVLDLMRDLVSEFGMAILFITHDLGVIAQTADEVAVMYLGRLVEQGPVREVIHDPRHPYTKGLIKALPDLEHLDQQLVPVAGDIPSPLERPEGCVFHTRCPSMIAGRCEKALPEMETVAPNHRAACFALEGGAQ